MVTLSIYAGMKAKPGKEKDVEEFLKSALPLVQAELGTIAWFAIKTSPGNYGIFDVFETEEARNAHLTGKVAQALMAKAPELFSEAPNIGKPELLAAKMPK